MLCQAMGIHNLFSPPTTNSGTLIDNVYYNGTLNGVIVEVSDTYYSDHDAVFVSIPTIDIPNVCCTIVKPPIVHLPNVLLPSVTVPATSKKSIKHGS